MTTQEKRVPIWEYRPRNAIERRAKYSYCIKHGLSQAKAIAARDWDWPRIDKYIADKKRANDKGGGIFTPAKAV